MVTQKSKSLIMFPSPTNVRAFVVHLFFLTALIALTVNAVQYAPSSGSDVLHAFRKQHYNVTEILGGWTTDDDLSILPKRAPTNFFEVRQRRPLG